MKHMRRKGKQPGGGLKQSTIGLAIAATLIACNQSAERPSKQVPTATEDCRAIVHDAGETTVCGRPQTVVTIGPNLLELLLALEVQPVGHAEYFPLPVAVFDQPVQQIPYLGKRLTSQPRNVGTAHDPALEVIAELEPDLILGDTLKNRDEYALLSQIAPTLLFTYNGADQDWQSDLQAIAQALDRTDQADTVIADFHQRKTALRAAIAPQAAQQLNVLLLLSQRLDQEIRIETRHSACGGLLEDLGFQVIAPKALEDSSQASHAISLEALPQLDADLIIIESFNSDVNANAADPIEAQLQDVRQQWRENAIAQSLPASQNGHVYFTTVYLCHALLGPIGAEIFLEQLHQQLSGEALDAKSVH